MIYSIEQTLTLSVPITLAAHRQAQLFYAHHPDLCKAKQVYLNTLAVEAVGTYLSWLGLAAETAASDSWNPVMQTLADVADLHMPGQGSLECRPVLPDATTFSIAPAAKGDLIGYLPVLFDEALESATLLGFMPSAKVSAEASAGVQEMPLSQLAPVSSLFDHLKPQPSRAAQPKQPARTKQQPVHLGAWLKGAMATGWQSVETLFAPQPALNFRTLALPEPGQTPTSAISGKLLELGPLRQVALIVGILQSDTLSFDIWVKLCPQGSDPTLPERLEVRILDDTGTAVMEAQSRQTDMLQLNFRGTLNEQFSVEVALDDDSLVEAFVI